MITKNNTNIEFYNLENNLFIKLTLIKLKKDVKLIQANSILIINTLFLNNGLILIINKIFDKNKIVLKIKSINKVLVIKIKYLFQLKKV